MTTPGYRVTEVEDAGDRPCHCSDCEWAGAADLTVEIGTCALTPGDPSPVGRCPQCDSLAYLDGEIRAGGTLRMFSTEGVLLAEVGNIDAEPLPKLDAQRMTKWLASGGGKCPACGGEDCAGGEVTIDAHRATQDAWCLACEAEWTDVYQLIGYERFDPGTPRDPENIYDQPSIRQSIEEDRK